jgi:hypothetical protein
MPFTKTIRTARSHMIANPPELGAIDWIRSVVISIYASDATHQCCFQPIQISLVRNFGAGSLRTVNAAAA